MTTFASLALSPTTLAAIDDFGYKQPTPIQIKAIPEILAGHDIVAAAKTGTGKTAAFALPVLDRLNEPCKPRYPSVLVITPTRELAHQIETVCSTIAAHTHHRCASVVGGVAINPQIANLRRGVDCLIATPGRLIDLINQNAVELSHISVLVIDEADRMLDMGFLPAVKTIVNATPHTRQTLLFSATVDQSVLKSVHSMLRDPVFVQVAVKGDVADTIKQYVSQVPHALKFTLLKAVLKTYGHKRVIVFTRTKRRCDTTCRKLVKAGFNAQAIHADRSQNQRKIALQNFASGKTDILVATDVLARGIDVDEVTYVVNFDVPATAEDYVHRIGRTGRAGKDGFALTFASPEDAHSIAAIESFIHQKLEHITVDGFDVEAAAQERANVVSRAEAKRDPELAQAAREFAKKQRQRQKRHAENQDSPIKHGTSRRKSAAKAPHTAHARDVRPGRSHRAALAEQRKKKR